jgi:hypothetical protein
MGVAGDLARRMPKTFIAVDLGAGSGRVIAATTDFIENRTRGTPPLRQSGHRPARRLVLERHRPLPGNPRRPAPRRRRPWRLDRLHRHRHLGLRPRPARPGRRVVGTAAPIPRPAFRGHGRGDARADAARRKSTPAPASRRISITARCTCWPRPGKKSGAFRGRSGCCSCRTCSPTGSPGARRSNARSPPPPSSSIRAPATGPGR